MLSASTISSSSSSAFSTNNAGGGGGGFSTPSSLYSQNDNTRKPLGGGNPLTELIETEQSFMETLKMIDSQIAPIWMKQMTSAAPDFSELLKYIHDILKANKRFCMKLTKTAANPQAMSELGDILMQWVNDLEVPYANYCRSYIPNLNQRTDVLRNPAIQALLHNLSANVSYEINLESLFNAPIQQLKYYKGLYSRLLDGTDSGRADHKLLLNANKRIDMIMTMARNNNPPPTASSSTTSRQANNQLNIQTNFQSTTNSDLTTFEQQVDCSRTVDLYTGAQINYQLRLSSHPGTQLVMRDSFVMIPENGGPSIRAHLVLTTEVLAICRELNSQQFLLMYPGIPIGDVTVKAESLDREIVGEYLVCFSVLGKKHILMRADSKEIRNTWIGLSVDQLGVNTASKSLSSVAQKKMLGGANSFLNQEPQSVKTIQKKTSNKSIRNTDIFTYYHENGGVSPLESSDEEEEEEFKSHNPLFNKQQAQPTAQQPSQAGKSRDTIMDIYDGHLYDFGQDANEFPLPPKQQQTVNNSNSNNNTSNVTHGTIPTATPNKDKFNVSNNVPSIPSTTPLPSVSQPVKDSSHVQMQYIQAPTAQMATMTISTPTIINSPLPTSSSSTSLSSSIYNNNNNNTPPPPPVPINTNYNTVGSQMKNNMMNDNSKPSSPRAVEVQRAVIPEAMQAVTQKTDEYIQQQVTTVPQIPRTSSMRHGPSGANSSAQGPPPPTPSKVMSPTYQQQQNGGYAQQQHGGGYAQQQQQQRPMMMNGGQQQRPPPSPGMQQQPYGYNRPMPSPPPQQQQFRPNNNMNYNNGGARPMMSPQLSPSLSNNTRRGPPPPPSHQTNNQYGVQQPPGRFNAPSPAIQHLQPGGQGLSAEELSSPPHSPNPYNPGNDIRQILYSSSQCDVFHWNNNSWYAADGQCLLQVRVTHMNRACVAVQLQNTGQLYLNAWILPTTVIRQPSPTDVSISVYMGLKKENYLVHFEHPQDANVFSDILRKVHADSAHLEQQQYQQYQQQQPVAVEEDHEEPVDTVNVPQTLKPVMQCKAKLFIKNETSSWSTFGGVTMRISQQAPSMRMMIQIENDKTKLVSAIVKSGNVEKISSKRISFLLVDEVQKTSIVYMVHLKEDQTGNKIYEYLRTKNAENGW